MVLTPPQPVSRCGLTSVVVRLARRGADDNEGVFGPGTLTLEEVSEIQSLANKYNTKIDVIGSRAACRGRNINTVLAAPSDIKGPRSDIDFRYDGRIDIDTDGRFWQELRNIGNGAGSTASDAGPGGSKPPVIEFTPNAPPVHIRSA
jgi:hypothetical protein